MSYYRNIIYTVKPNDTLWKIANMYQVGISELINANPQIPNPNLYTLEQITINNNIGHEQKYPIVNQGVLDN